MCHLDASQYALVPCLISHGPLFPSTTTTSSSLFLRLWVVPHLTLSTLLVRSISTTSNFTGSQAKVLSERFVCLLPNIFVVSQRIQLRFASLNIKEPKSSMLSSTWTSSNASSRSQSPTSSRKGDCLRRCGYLSAFCSLPHRPITGRPPLLG